MLKAEAWHELIVGTFTSHKHPYFFFQGANWDTRFLMDTKRLSLRNYVASGADFLRVMAQESLGCWRFLLVTSICDHIEAPSARIASVHSHCMRQKSWNLCKHPPTNLPPSWPLVSYIYSYTVRNLVTSQRGLHTIHETRIQHHPIQAAFPFISCQTSQHHSASIWLLSVEWFGRQCPTPSANCCNQA